MTLLERLKRKKIMDPLTAVLYLVPAGVIVVVFRMIPIGSAFVLSFFDVKMGRVREPMSLDEAARLARDYGRRNISVASDVLAGSDRPGDVE